MPKVVNFVEHEMPEFNETLFSSPLVHIGRFYAPAAHPNFVQSGVPARDYFTFPLNTVRVQRAEEDPFVADPNVVGFFNRHEPYFRAKLDEQGARSHSFSVAPATLREVLSHFDPAAAAPECRAFPRSHAPTEASTFLRQHDLIRRLRQSLVGPLAVEEETVSIFARVMAGAFGSQVQREGPRSVARQNRRRAAEIAEAARSFLAIHFREQVLVQHLAEHLGVAPFFLMRVFRSAAGIPIHAYLNQLRLRSALEPLLDTSIDLTNLALDLGFNSHSHFSAAFRRAFGTTPSAWRERRSSRRLPAAQARLARRPCTAR